MCNIFIVKHVFFHCELEMWKLSTCWSTRRKEKWQSFNGNSNKTSFACNSMAFSEGKFQQTQVFTTFILLTILIYITFFDLIFDTIFHRNQWDPHGFPQVGFFFFFCAPEKKVSHRMYVSLISKVNPYSWIGEARIEFGVPFCSLFFKLLIYLPLNYCTISIFSVYVNFTEKPCYLAAWALYGFFFGKTGTFYEPEKSNWRKKCKQCKANKNDDTNGNGNEMKRCQKGDCLVC